MDSNDRIRGLREEAAGLSEMLKVAMGGLTAARAEIERLQLQLATRATTCAYCGAVHALPCTMDDIQAHVESCPKHPLAAALDRVRELEANAELGRLVRSALPENSCLRINHNKRIKEYPDHVFAVLVGAPVPELFGPWWGATLEDAVKTAIRCGK